MNELLPLGSVVQLKNGLKKVMICGRLQQQTDTGRIWDYSACLYPEGIIDPQEMYLFDNDSIDRLYYVGMQDADEFEYRRYLMEEFMAQTEETEETEEEDA